MSVQLQLGSTETRLEGLTARVFAGRDPAACQLHDADATLSRRHAEIYVENGTVFVRDLGSANGTWVDGTHLGHDPVPLHAGSQIWLGHVPLGVHWEADGSRTVMATDVPPELKALIAAKAAVAMAPPPMAPPPALSPSASAITVASSGSTSTPTPAEFAYRKQGHNSNGVILLALRQDTHFTGGAIDGYVEFTSLDNQTVASITVELVQFHAGGAKTGHVWDRVLVRQGPWRAQHNDILPLPFQLRIPPGTSMTTRDVHWEIRAGVDINWASDIHNDIGITMRNQDIERLRDALGALDYRVESIESAALGQHFEGTFAPPAQLAKEWGVADIKLIVEYLGANLKIRMLVEKRGLHHDKALDQVFERGRLDAASQADINATIKAMLDQLIPAK